jgi:hypothetical protein
MYRTAYAEIDRRDPAAADAFWHTIGHLVAILRRWERIKVQLEANTPIRRV